MIITCFAMCPTQDSCEFATSFPCVFLVKMFAGNIPYRIEMVEPRKSATALQKETNVSKKN